MAPDTRTLSDSPSTGQSSYKPWAIGLLFAHRNRILSNLSRFYQQLARLPRRVRRAFGRRAALTVTAAALVLVISQSPVRADTITVRNGEVLVRNNGRCSLIEAILNAEDTIDGEAHDDCAAGDPSGSDTIILPDGGRFVLTRPFSDDDGLPPLTGEIFIQGNNSVIERSNRAGTLAFRLATVSSGADIVLDGVTLSGGYTHDYGGGVFVENDSRLTISNSVIENNHAAEDGAGIYIEESSGERATVVIESSAIRNNSATSGELRSRAGGISNHGGIVTIRNSTVSGNVSTVNAGGILNDNNPNPAFLDPSMRIY